MPLPETTLAATLDAAIWRRAARELRASRIPDGTVACRILADVDATTGGRSGTLEVRDVLCRMKDILAQHGRTLELQRIPVIPQRTPEWYAARHEMITASDVAQCLGHGKFSTPRAFFEKKVPPLSVPGTTTSTSGAGDVVEDVSTLPDPPVIPPLKWGTMFEDAAINVYDKRTDAGVTPFGLLRHPDPSVPLGASPDGITDAGVMLEIKCPFMRVIDGQVPLQYYYQIQAQLEVCGLRCCDFLECSFSAYEDEDAFFADRLVTDDEDGDLDPEASYCGLNGREKGVIAEYVEIAEDGVSAKHAYAYLDDLCPSRRRVQEWKAAATADVSRRRRFSCFHFWRLETFSVARVDKDERFVRDMISDVKAVWEKVVLFRADPEAYQKYLASSAPPQRSGRKSASKDSKDSKDPKDSKDRQNVENDGGGGGGRGAVQGYAFVGFEDEDDDV